MDPEKRNTGAQDGDTNSEYWVGWEYESADENGAPVLVDVAVLRRVDETDAEFEKRQTERFKWLCSAAEQGDSEAQFELGQAIVDDPYAASWLQAAAEQDHAEACMALAQLKIDSPFLPEEVDRTNNAIKWYRRGRELGCPHKPESLGIQTVEDIFGSSSIAIVSRYMTAAQNGKIEAQFLLGCLYAHGCQDAAPDLHKAYAWFRVAARGLWGGGSDESQYPRQKVPFIGEITLNSWHHAPDWHAQYRASGYVRVLEIALDVEELSRAQELANEYLRDYGTAIGYFKRRRIKYGSTWNALAYPLFGFRR